MRPPGTLSLTHYTTPASQYPITSTRRVRLRRSRYDKGSVYEMYGVRGYQYMLAEEPITVTRLQLLHNRRWKTWMVDDPMHWMAIQEIVETLTPPVLVAGLGLGLIVHALHAAGKADGLVVVERDANVIGLIHPLLPPIPGLKIVCEDFWRYLRLVRRGAFPSLFIDLWVGKGEALWPEVKPRVEWVEHRFPYPETNSIFFGFHGPIAQRRTIQTLINDHLALLNDHLKERIG